MSKKHTQRHLIGGAFPRLLHMGIKRIVSSDESLGFGGPDEQQTTTVYQVGPSSSPSVSPHQATAETRRRTHTALAVRLTVTVRRNRVLLGHLTPRSRAPRARTSPSYHRATVRHSSRGPVPSCAALPSPRRPAREGREAGAWLRPLVPADLLLHSPVWQIVDGPGRVASGLHWGTRPAPSVHVGCEA